MRMSGFHKPVNWQTRTAHLLHLLYLKGQTSAEPQESNQPGLNI